MITILSPTHSFVKFSETPETHCIWGDINFCLPVYEENDVAFQFVLQASSTEEADALCDVTNDNVEIGLVLGCNDEDFALQFTEKPERFRISDTQVLYNWQHGLPDFVGAIGIGQCFYIRIQYASVYELNQFCSNCFQRIASDCFSSVIEYGNDENAFGFNYCGAGVIDSDQTDSCTPTEISFINQTTLTIPYTTSLANRYGDTPTVKGWLYNESGELVNMTFQILLIGLPVTTIYCDFGGLASGKIIIR